MADFSFLKNPYSGTWVSLAPRRAKRPDVANGPEPVCPFCAGREKEEKEVYRVLASNDNESDWLIRVIPNKFPFAPIHEVIIHSQDHHKNFGELPSSQVELIFQTYRQRYNTHKDKGQVCIFHNRGSQAGESLPHPHTQLAVVPFDITIDTPTFHPDPKEQHQESASFLLSCPSASQWPDEVWISPKKPGVFGDISDTEVADLADLMTRLIQIFDLRHGHEFSYNFYIFPGVPWYLRLIPRQKTIGGFELSTGIFVNTQDPKETMAFIKTHFENPDEERIRREHKADYRRHV